MNNGGQDCDDDNILISPSEDESCDGIDNDCDDLIDDDDDNLHHARDETAHRHSHLIADNDDDTDRTQEPELSQGHSCEISNRNKPRTTTFTE